MQAVYQCSTIIFFRIARTVPIFLFAAFFFSCQKQVLPLKNGSVNISSLSTEDVVSITAPWEFYWDRLLTPKDFQQKNQPAADGRLSPQNAWKTFPKNGGSLPPFGKATYRLTVYVDHPYPLYGVKIVDALNAFRFYVNGRLESSWGVVDDPAAHHAQGINTKVAIFALKPGRNELVLQIANYTTVAGGKVQDLYLGTAEAVIRERQWATGLELAAFGILLITAVYHFLLFILRREDRANIYFSVFCLLFAMKRLFEGEHFFLMHFPHINLTVYHQIWFLCYYIAIPFIILFFREMFRRDFSKWVVRYHLVMTPIAAVIIVLLPRNVFSLAIPVFHLLIFPGAFECVRSVTMAVIRGERGARVGLAGTLIFLGCGINDMLFTIDILETPYLVTLGFLAFIVFQSYMISMRFSDALADKEAAYKALEEREEKYESIYTNLEDVYFETALDGTLLEISPSIHRIFGVHPETLLNRSIAAHYDNPKEPRKILGTLIKNGAIRDYRIDFSDDNGRKRRCAVNARLISDSGKPVKIVGLLRNVEEHLLLEEERLKSSKLESLGQLAGGIAHDFNNILMGLVANLNLLELKKFGQDPMISEFIQNCYSVVDQAKLLAKQLLTFAKGGKPIRQPINLVPLVRQAADFANAGSNCAVKYRYSHNEIFVNADRGQMFQVIQNVVRNAVDVMPNGGVIAIDLDTQESGNEACLNIKDTGPGIDKAVIGRLFEPYFTTRVGGHGLGLATAHAIVKNHNGRLSVRSKSGEGAEFSICLPLLSPSAITEYSSDEDIRPLPAMIHMPLKVLLMDDSEIICATAKSGFEAIGSRLVTVREGKSAIAEYRKAIDDKDPFDAVLMDLTIRDGMGGLETIKTLKEIDPDVKAVVVSGYATNPVMANPEQYGFCCTIPKPWRINKVAETLNRIVTAPARARHTG